MAWKIVSLHELNPRLWTILFAFVMARILLILFLFLVSNLCHLSFVHAFVIFVVLSCKQCPIAKKTASFIIKIHQQMLIYLIVSPRFGFPIASTYTKFVGDNISNLFLIECLICECALTFHSFSRYPKYRSLLHHFWS